MLTHPTIDQLRALRLDGMAEAFVELQSQDAAKDLAPAEWLALLLDREAAHRGTQRFKSRLRNAKLRHGQASIEDVDYRAAATARQGAVPATGRRPLDRRASQSAVTGPCGVGKSWLSCALAQKACRDGYTVHYARVPRLFADLELAHGDGRFARLFRTLTKADLLILDDWGPDRLSANQRRDLMEIVEDRYGARLDADHQPVAGRCLARGHRRADLRRRHPRSPRAQRLSSRARRAVDARSQDGQVGHHSAGAERGGYDGHETGDRSKEMNTRHRPARARRCV